MMKEELEKRLHNIAELLYEQGFEDGKSEAVKLVDNGYKHGAHDAWECAKKVVLPSYEGGMEYGVFKEIFGECGYQRVLKKYNASEVMQKIKEYEERQKRDERKVDCEVTACNNCVNHNIPHCIYSDKEVAESFLEDVSAVEEQLKQDEKSCINCLYALNETYSKTCRKCVTCEEDHFEPKQTDATDIDDGSIKVGDEVINGGVVGVVTHVREIENGMKAFTVMDKTGKVWNFNDLIIKRTGRFFPQIAEVLRQLRGDKG